ncbi:eukaryotic integral membrane protein-domain-containing protein [Delphinella strobiligena]|nr:eukaryotic integral membrane protein-domain-containing protein [Delphinella strobiligena]
MPRVNIPPLTRSLLVALFTLTLFNASLRYRQWASSTDVKWSALSVPFLTIVPGKSLRYPYVMLTSALIEQNVFSYAASALTIFYGGRYLERAWGGGEFAKFVLFVTMIPNILSFLVYRMWYTVSGNEVRAITIIHGALALEAGFLVAFKQLVPEHTVSLFKGALRMRVKHFPAVFVLLNSLSGPLLGTDTAFFLSWFGFLTSWIYLRFYRVAPSLSTSSTGEGAVIKGDASDTFTFAHFFPERIQVLLDPLCDSVYKTLIAARVCTPFSDEAIDAGNEQAQARADGGLPSLMNGGRGGRGGGGGRREEAERRRALALRALDQRLNAAAASRSADNQAGATSLKAGTTEIEADSGAKSVG